MNTKLIIFLGLGILIVILMSFGFLTKKISNKTPNFFKALTFVVGLIFLLVLGLILYLKMFTPLNGLIFFSLGSILILASLILRPHFEIPVIPIILAVIGLGFYFITYNSTVATEKDIAATIRAQKANKLEAKKNKDALKAENSSSNDLKHSKAITKKNHQKSSIYKEYYKGDSKNLKFLKSHVNTEFALNIVDVNHRTVIFNHSTVVYAVLSLGSSNSRQFLPIFSKISKRYPNYEFVCLFPVDKNEDTKRYLNKFKLGLIAASGEINQNISNKKNSRISLKNYIIDHQQVTDIPTIFIVQNNQIHFTRIGSIDENTLIDVINQGTENYVAK